MRVKSLKMTEILQMAIMQLVFHKEVNFCKNPNIRTLFFHNIQIIILKTSAWTTLLSTTDAKAYNYSRTTPSIF